MPESLWKNWPKNVLVYSCFLVVALLLVELSVASSDIASLGFGQVTRQCSAPMSGSALVQVSGRVL